MFRPDVRARSTVVPRSRHAAWSGRYGLGMARRRRTAPRPARTRRSRVEQADGNRAIGYVGLVLTLADGDEAVLRVTRGSGRRGKLLVSRRRPPRSSASGRGADASSMTCPSFPRRGCSGRTWPCRAGTTTTMFGGRQLEMRLVRRRVETCARSPAARVSRPKGAYDLYAGRGSREPRGALHSPARARRSRLSRGLDRAGSESLWNAGLHAALLSKEFRSVSDASGVREPKRSRLSCQRVIGT